MRTEADTCREFVLPRLQDAGWDTPPRQINEQRSFTAGRIVVTASGAKRRPWKRADYILRYTRDFPIAVVEAKSEYRSAGDGIQQAKEYAEILGLNFAYATNGEEIIEYDFLTGYERVIPTFPAPDELWQRLRGTQGLTEDNGRQLLTPAYHESSRTPRYYQEIAINRAVQAIVQGKRRVLLTMATGTGKTVVAFQICWKLWNAHWNRNGIPNRRPRILYLADRNVLVDDPKDKTFTPFGAARWKIQGGVAQKSREMYFATYQSIAKDERRPGLYREYAPDFFDLIVVDECHRGSARDESNWRDILEYFEPAAQLGMTATPLREDNRDTYRYFGAPLFQYSLRQGIEDGFLAPYKVHRVVTTWDAVGWRPMQGEQDRYGREIPDDEYHTKDFERTISLPKRTEAIARHLTEHLHKTGRFDKTIVFCVDQEHADDMRRALSNLNADLVREHPHYVARVTSDEGERGRGHLSNFQEPERLTPAILTTSQLLTTGVDVPTCRNVVIARVVESMTEFKQIIGRGTRVREDYDKLYFTILDYTGSATQLFADPDFDGYPVSAIVETVDTNGETLAVEDETDTIGEDDTSSADEDGDDYNPDFLGDDEGPRRRKFYVDHGYVEIVADVVYSLDADGKRLRVVSLSDYTGEHVRSMYASAADMRALWADPDGRAAIVAQLAERGIEFESLAAALKQPDADAFDLLCHIAFNAPLRTRRERADRLRLEKRDFFDEYGGEAHAILDELLDKYAEHGTDQFVIPDVLKVPPISSHGNIREIVGHFGGAAELREAVIRLQSLLYAA